MSAEQAPRMITLAISLYNDFARWSMDRCEIPYSEERHALVLHTFASRRAGGKGTTPVLVAADDVIGESALIAEWADRRAAPLCPPEGLPVPMPQPDEFSEPTAGVMRELREHPAGQYALRLYRDER